MKDLKDVTVEEADARRNRKRATNVDELQEVAPRQVEVQKLRRVVATISRSSADLANEAAFARATDTAEILIPMVRTAIAELQQLLRHLEDQASGKASGGA